MNIRLTNFGWGFHHDSSLQQGLVLHLTQLWKLSSCDLCLSLKLFLSCLHFSTHFYKKKVKYESKNHITTYVGGETKDVCKTDLLSDQEHHGSFASYEHSVKVEAPGRPFICQHRIAQNADWC